MAEMTLEEYGKTGGLKCPFCKSENITGGAWSADFGAAWQEVHCEACGKDWNDLYALTGYQE